MTRTEDTNISQVTEDGDISIYHDKSLHNNYVVLKFKGYSGNAVLNYKGYSDDDAGVVFCPVNSPRQDDKEKYSETDGMPIFFGNIADNPDL